MEKGSPLRSFWSSIRGKVDYDETNYEELSSHLAKRQKLTLAMTPGVGYEWITCPLSWSSNDGYCWSDVDHYFQGATSSELKHVEQKREEQRQRRRKRKKDASINDTRNEDYPDNDDIVYDDIDNATKEEFTLFRRIHTYPDRFFENTGLPSASKLAGTYDLIFYAGEYEYYLRHHRTTRGILELSFADNDGPPRLCGEVSMDPTIVQRMDVIPFGGNFKFEETARYQRVTYQEYKLESGTRRYEKVENPKFKATGTIEICVTEPPQGLHTYHQYTKQGQKWNSSAKTGRCSKAFTGELRIFEKKTGTGFLPEPKLASDDWPRSEYARKVETLAVAEDLLAKHYDKTCSWLHNHTQLTRSVASKIGEFLCPPPVFFFEKGDLCIDMDWSSGLDGGSASTCIVARRRHASQTLINNSSVLDDTSKNTADVSNKHAKAINDPGYASSPQTQQPKSLLSTQDLYLKEVNEYERAIENLELKRDMIHFADYCSNKVNMKMRNNLQLEFFKPDALNSDNDNDNDNEIENHKVEMQWYTIAKRCFLWMEKDFFNEQLAKYSLRMENIETFFNQSHDVGYRIWFSKVK